MKSCQAAALAFILPLLFAGRAYTLDARQEHLEERAAKLFEEARSLELQGEASRALARYKGLISAYPRTSHAPVAQFQIARLYHANEEYIPAFKAYETLINTYHASDLFLEAIEGEFRVAEEALKRTLAKQRQPDKAPAIQLPDMATLRDMYRVIITQATQTEFAPRALYSLAVTYQMENDAPTAQEIFGRINDEYPLSILSDDAAFQLAFIEYQEGTRNGIHLGHLKKSRLLFEDFLVRFAGSDKVPEAKYLLSRIDLHEISSLQKAAEFYQRRGDTKAAALYRNRLLAVDPELLAQADAETSAESTEVRRAEPVTHTPEHGSASPTPDNVETSDPMAQVESQRNRHPPIVLQGGDGKVKVIEP